MRVQKSNTWIFLQVWFSDRYNVGQSESRRWEMRRYCLCAVMICNQDNVIKSCNRIIFGSRKIKSGHSHSSRMYLSLHDRYIAYVYPICCDCIVGNFPRRTFGIGTINLFLFTFCGMWFHIKRRTKFCQSVSPVFWCLFIELLPVLPDMTGWPTVFCDV